MAMSKSTPATRKGTVKQSPSASKKIGKSPSHHKKAAETVLVPVLSEPYAKAPAVDPQLRSGTVTTEHVNVCGYQLPPIMRGIQPGKGLSGEPQDYSVKVVWMSRRQIEAMMASVEKEYPELAQMLEIMKSFMCHLDTMRDESKFGVAASLSWIRAAMPPDSPAISNLEGVMRMLGRWNDEVRLPLH